MPKYQTLARFFRFTLAAVLALPLQAFAESQYIFPGQPLPASIPLLPLKVSSTPNSDVSVNARDWFLLKDRQLNLQSPTIGKTLDYIGPVLDTQNGRSYFRMISGMILKSTLIEMKMNPASARRFIERAQQQGKDLEQTPLAELGDLPEGFHYLYENWDREGVRVNIIPNLLLPLAVANHSSQFQHFYQAGVNDSKEQKTCSTINTVEPLGPVQAKIDEKQKTLDGLNAAVSDAEILKRKSAAEQTRLNDLITNFSKQINSTTNCFNVFSSRIARGGAKPNETCLADAAEAIENAVKENPSDESKIRNAWKNFNEVNLVREDSAEGDIAKSNRLNAELTAADARVKEAQNRINSLQNGLAKLQSGDDKTPGIREKQDKIKRLNDDLNLQQGQYTQLSTELENQKVEQRKIQDYNHLVETNSLPANDTAKISAIDETGARNKAMVKIQSRIAVLTDSLNKIQANQTALNSQVEFLNRSIDSDRAQIQSNEEQLAQAKPELAALQEKYNKLLPDVQAANDQASISGYFVSLITNKLNTLSRSNSEQYASLKREQANMANIEAQLAKAKQSHDGSADGIQAEVTSLQKSIASYHDESQMGWFLEQSCDSRADLSRDKAALYLSRAPIEKPYVTPIRGAASIPTAPVDAGRWGLFNMDYAHFSAPIQSGVLLNVPAYVQVSVHQILEDYNDVMTQYFNPDPSAHRCAETEMPRLLSAALPSLMRSAYIAWSEGSDKDAKLKAVSCQNGGALDARLVNDSRSFQTNLQTLTTFEGSLLDRALPEEARSKPEDLIERRAVSLLSREFGILAGTVRAPTNLSSIERRDALIKALIRVLAFDYTTKMNEQTVAQADPNQIRYEFATYAPGFKPGQPSAPLQAGAILPIKTIGLVKLYTGPSTKSNEAGSGLSLNDSVQVVAQEEAGWVRVKAPYVSKDDLWMPAWPLQSSTLLDESGNALARVTDLQDCADPRLVTSLNNYRRTNTVERYSGSIQTAPIDRSKKVWEIDAYRTPKVAAAVKGRLYLACVPGYTVPNQPAALNVGADLQGSDFDYKNTLAVRIVEAQAVRAANGQVVYLPIENVGGFVSTWALDRNGAHPQIILGDHIDPITWSVKK